MKKEIFSIVMTVFNETEIQLKECLNSIYGIKTSF